jgi:hypothetical protein
MSSMSVGAIGHSQDGIEWEIHVQISDEYARDMSSNKSRTICTQVRCPPMFAKMPFGFSPLDVNLIEKGHSLQFLPRTTMQAGIRYQRRFSPNKANPYLAR